MFEHLKLFGNFVNVLVGVWVIVYLLQVARSYKYRYLRYLVYHTFFYNLLALTHFISKYSDLNLPKDFVLKQSPVSREVVFYLIYLFFIAMTYCIFRINLSFRDKTIGFWTRRIVIAIISLLIMIPIALFILSISGISAGELSEEVIDLCITFIFLCEFVFLIWIRIYSWRSKDFVKGKKLNLFSYLYFSRYALMIIFIGLYLLFSLSGEVGGILSRSMLIYFNLVPFLWVRFGFLKYARQMISGEEIADVMTEIKKKYEITKREREILELILRGKSNKEICGDLYISIHTVKNHIYSIYQKMDINSRYQLVHFFNNYKAK